jgi:Tetratricopeptide repeat
VLPGCISCHSGRPNPVDQDTGKYLPETFSQTAIGCENCHGPGAAHVHEMRLSPALRNGSKIVNPEHLSAPLENDICMSCHEAGDARVPRPGKTYQDFRPGTPLDDVVSILMVPLKPDAPDDSDHVQHYFEMSMSKCFRATAGQLRCATCHNPHVEPTNEEAPAVFNAKCMDCHANRMCTLPAAQRKQTSPADNCIGCHMPSRDTPQTAHTSLTNHRILVRPGEPWPDEAFQQTTPELPDLIHLNRVPGRDEDLPAMTLLEGYREIAERKPEYSAAYQETLSRLERSDPENAVVQQALGRRDFENGAANQAIEHLELALKLDPGLAAAYSYLSETLAQQGEIDSAIAASEKAVSLEPYNALYQKALIDRLIAGRQYDKAIAAMDHYLELFPEDAFMRRMLEIAKQ